MAGENKKYICPSCGAGLEWSPAAQKIVCPFCGSEYVPEYFEKQEQQAAADLEEQQYPKGEDASELGYDSEKDATDESAENAIDLRVYKCSVCGAEIVTDKTTVATNCAFCGSPVVLTEQLDTDFRPKWILPFRVDKAKVEEIYWQYAKGRPFTPDLFRSRSQIEKIKSVYLPFWLYDMDMQGTLTARGEKTFTSSDKHFVYTTHQIYDLQRAGTVSLEKVPVDASSRSPNDAMDSIEPFDLHELKPFRMGYMAGFLAERYDQDEKLCYARALRRATQTMNDVLQQSVGGFASLQVTSHEVYQRGNRVTGDILNQAAPVSGIKADYALLPVYILFTKYEGREYLFAVNGQTGKTVGDVPVSKKKMILFFILCFIILTGVFYLLGWMFF
ncbi:MAG: hypothetical protein K5852_05495 [Eubacterium sp.]|nr:hypothetical protein [Eubacterium sp.]